MKWPFVSREFYEREQECNRIARAELLRERDLSDAKLEGAEKRYASLLEMYHTLKAAGAVVVPNPAEMQPLSIPQRDELKELIGEVCGTDFAKRKVMLRQLAVDRAANVKDDVIRAAILQGVQGEGVPS